MGEDAAQSLPRRSPFSASDGEVCRLRISSGEPGRDIANRQDEIGKPGGDCAARHGCILGLLRILNENDAAGFLHRPDAHGAIGTGAGKDDGEAIAVLRGQRAEEEIDRRALPARLVERGYRQMVVGDDELPIGRNDIDMAGLEAHPAET